MGAPKFEIEEKVKLVNCKIGAGDIAEVEKAQLYEKGWYYCVSDHLPFYSEAQLEKIPQ